MLFRSKAPIKSDGELLAGYRDGAIEFTAFVEGERHWFFTQDMETGLESLDAMLRVQAIRRTHGNDVDALFVIQQVFDTGIGGRAILLSEALRLSEIDIAYRLEAAAIVDMFRMSLRDPATADYRKIEMFVHCLFDE